MTKVFDSTREIDGHIFIEACSMRSYEDRQSFIDSEVVNMMDSEHIYMLYIGGGYVPLAVAVIATNESDAVSAMEEYMRNNNRLDEIGEDDPGAEFFGEYELMIEMVPIDVVAGLIPPPPPEPITRYHHVRALEGRQIRISHREGVYTMTGDVRKSEDRLFTEVEVYQGKPLYREYIEKYRIIR